MEGSGETFLLELSDEDRSWCGATYLELVQLVRVEETVLVDVGDPEYPFECFEALWFECLTKLKSIVACTRGFEELTCSRES